jgi:LPXTG-site transpeptidase (sortase) family protein
MFKVKSFKNNKTFSIIKYIIAFVLITLSVYLIYPYWPKAQYYFNSLFNKNVQIPVSFSQIAQESALNPNSIPVEEDNLQEQNFLTIPKINVKAEILESQTLDILEVKEGVWREPGSSTPIVAGNMVIAGHRFQYLPPNTNTFYNLEEMVIGDDIIVEWQGIKFWYRVYKTQLVNPDQIEIRDSNENYIREITLYTCTPLYTSDKRFVVKAGLVGYSY